MATFSERIGVFLGPLGVILILGFGLVQIYAAFLGIDYHWGAFAAILIIAASFFFRFTLPLTIAVFFGALDVWEWHWFWALIFAAPGLILVIPGMLAQLLAVVLAFFGSREKL